MTDQTPASADQVAAYLREHADFFQHRPELLELLRLPDSKGEAVSLLERQASILRERNTELRDRLNGLLDVARENDHLFDKTRRLTLSLLEARGAEKLFRNLLTSLKAREKPAKKAPTSLLKPSMSPNAAADVPQAIAKISINSGDRAKRCTRLGST